MTRPRSPARPPIRPMAPATRADPPPRPAAEVNPTPTQRIVPIRREYNAWVADETIEDYALR